MKKSTLTVAIGFLIAGFGSSASAQFIYVANAGEDTVSKIDISNNTEVARYATWFTAGTNHVAHLGNSQFGPAPSRIARDTAGNAFVLDRFFATHVPVLLKIAASGGGATSSGSGISAVLPMLDNNSNNDIDIPNNEAADTRILWAQPIGPASDQNAWGRALCIDTTGNLWVGMFNTMHYYKVDPTTGAVIGGPVSTPGHTPYGCQVDVNGKLWSVDANHTLAEIDTTTNALVTVLDYANFNGKDYGRSYSLSLYNDCTSTPPNVKVYISERGLSKTYIVYDQQANTFNNSPGSVPQFPSLTVGVDRQGNIVSGAQNGTGRVMKTSPAGAVLWDTGPTLPAVQQIPDLHGIIIDANDDVWAVDRSFNGRVLKYSGANGSLVNPIVSVGNMPYTYNNPPPPTCSNTGGDDNGGCAPVKGDVRCLPNGDYSYTFTVTNKSGHAISQLLLTPVQGSTFTLAPQLANFTSPLQNGQSTTLTTTISGAKPGDKVCFFVSLLSEKDACCNKQMCLTMPDCKSTPPPPPPQKPIQLPRGKRRP